MPFSSFQHQKCSNQPWAYTEGRKQPHLMLVFWFVQSYFSIIVQWRQGELVEYKKENQQQGHGISSRRDVWNCDAVAYGNSSESCLESSRRKYTFGDTMHLRQFHARWRVMPYQACGLNKKIRERCSRIFLVGHQGLEPRTNRLWAGGSDQLS